MESTARFTGNDPDPSEKTGGRPQVVARHDLASRFSSEQRQVPHVKREAMGRALLEGVMFERPRQESVTRPPAQVSERTIVEEAARQPITRFASSPATERFTPQGPIQPEQTSPSLGRVEEQAEAESPQLNTGERLVRSEWHNIIVGADGRPVERNQYGQGFQQEQHVEQLPDPIANAPVVGGKARASDDHAMMGGSNPLYQQTTQHSLSTSSAPTDLQLPTLPSGMTSPTLPAGQPQYEDPQHLLAPPKPRSAKNPLLWVFFFALLAAFFVASLAG